MSKETAARGRSSPMVHPRSPKLRGRGVERDRHGGRPPRPGRGEESESGGRRVEPAPGVVREPAAERSARLPQRIARRDDPAEGM